MSALERKYNIWLTYISSVKALGGALPQNIRSGIKHTSAGSFHPVNFNTLNKTYLK